MKKIVLMALLALTLPVNAAEQPSDAQIAGARSDILRVLFDPQPLFTDVRAVSVEGQTAFCGYVAARNKFGGYTGQTPFIVTSTGMEIVDDDQNTRGYQRKMNLLQKFCNSDPSPVSVKF